MRKGYHYVTGEYFVLGVFPQYPSQVLNPPFMAHNNLTLPAGASGR